MIVDISMIHTFLILENCHAIGREFGYRANG
jgi:hypothetical protein